MMPPVRLEGPILAFFTIIIGGPLLYWYLPLVKYSPEDQSIYWKRSKYLLAIYLSAIVFPIARNKFINKDIDGPMVVLYWIILGLVFIVVAHGKKLSVKRKNT